MLDRCDELPKKSWTINLKLYRMKYILKNKTYRKKTTYYSFWIIYKRIYNNNVTCTLHYDFSRVEAQRGYILLYIFGILLQIHVILDMYNVKL